MELLPRTFDGCRTVVWDFDGVVADTEPVHQASYEAVLSELGYVPGPGWFTRQVGSREEEIWQRLEAEYRLGVPAGVLAVRRASAYRDLSSVLVPAWFVGPVLSVAAEHVVVSSGNHEQIELLLDRWGLRGGFRAVLATGSPGVPAGQPKADRLAARLSSAVGTAVVLEDAPRYLTQAAEAGARTVGVAHRLNDLSTVRCDLVVTHDRPGRWERHPLP